MLQLILKGIFKTFPMQRSYSKAFFPLFLPTWGIKWLLRKLTKGFPFQSQLLPIFQPGFYKSSVSNPTGDGGVDSKLRKFDFLSGVQFLPSPPRSVMVMGTFRSYINKWTLNLNSRSHRKSQTRGISCLAPSISFLHSDPCPNLSRMLCWHWRTHTHLAGNHNLSFPFLSSRRVH